MRKFFDKAKRVTVLTKGVCRDCQLPQAVEGAAWKRASMPRCAKCGGGLDRRGRWSGSKSVVVAFTPSDIKYPQTESEAEIQACLLYGLRLMGHCVRACVPAASGGMVFDLVVFDENFKAMRIIEVKKRVEKGSTQRQKARYEMFGVRVDFVCGRAEADAYLKRAEQMWAVPHVQPIGDQQSQEDIAAQYCGA